MWHCHLRNVPGTQTCHYTERPRTTYDWTAPHTQTKDRVRMCKKIFIIFHSRQSSKMCCFCAFFKTWECFLVPPVDLKYPLVISWPSAECGQTEIVASIAFICFSRMNSCVNRRQGLCTPERREIQSLQLSCVLIINIKNEPKVTQRCNIYIHPESDCEFCPQLSVKQSGNESCRELRILVSFVFFCSPCLLFFLPFSNV